MICYYVLTHSSSGVFYIGSTTNFKKRLIAHKQRLRTCNHPAIRLQEVYTLIPELTFETFPVSDIEEARTQEKKLIALHRGNIKLANYHGNIDESNRRMSEARVKANLAKKGIPLPESAKLKIGKLHKGKVVSDVMKAKISAANKGRRAPEGHIENLALLKSIKVLIDGVEHPSYKMAGMALGISAVTVGARVNSNDPRWNSWQKIDVCIVADT